MAKESTSRKLADEVLRHTSPVREEAWRCLQAYIMPDSTVNTFGAAMHCEIDRGKPVKIKHSRMSVVAAAFFMLNGVVIVVVSDAAPWLNYLILALVFGIGGLAACYISVPAFSFSTGECVVKQSPAVRAINLDMERVAA